MIIPTAIGAMFWIPKPKGWSADVNNKFRRLDIPGAFLMLAAIILLVLGLTLGASYGWKKPGFLVPFLLSWVLFPAFFVWEAMIPQEYALLPAATWKIKNFGLFMVLALLIYSWWSVNFLTFVEIFVDVHGEKPIIAALRILPEGLTAAVVTVILTVFPQLTARPRYPIIVGLVASTVGYVLMSQSGTQIGRDYWRFLFPGFIIGSGGMMMVFTGTNVGVMTSVPPEISGVAGALLQVCLQVGSAVALAVQAGLLTINPGGIENFQNPQASYYFMIGWCVIWLIGFVAWYRQPKADPADAEKAAVVVL